MTTPPHLGAVLASAVLSLRTKLDSTAALAVLAPSEVNATLARHELALATPFIRVSFLTPNRLHSLLAAPGLRARGLRPEPPGWLRATLHHELVQRDLGAYGEVMRAPGWLPALVSAIEALESGGLDAEALRSLGLDGDLRARAEVLAALLDAVKGARAREDIAGPADEADAARQAIASDATIPANEPRGVILLGDARNTRTVSDTLRAWLAKRAVVRLDLPAMHDLAPAWGGLTAAAPHAEVVSVEASVPHTRMVRTPDPVRECVEIVRRVQRAIRDEVALDRIAVVLPDPSEAVALREALDRAQVPATWQTGPPLSTAPSASLLTHAIELARGDDSVTSWYELLMRPGLRLRQELGADAVRGRGRWRRLLSSCGAYRGSHVIQTALRASLAELDPGEESESDRLAYGSLLKCVDHFAELFASWRTPRTVGRWAKAWLTFVSRYWREGTDKRALKSLLEGWSRADAGPPLSLSDAAVTLGDALAGTQVTVGSLRDASIRVLSPMQCLGAELEVVCVASMTQGRFPLDPSEDPILDDALVDAINAKLDAGLFRSSDRVALERRRFAAVRSAVRSELWVSCPRVDMMKGRPLLPGTLLLELAEELAGRRVGFEELDDSLEPAGRRSRAYPADPETALDAGEFLLSRLHASEAAVRAAALTALVDHPNARRLLKAHRAATLITSGGVHEELRPWAGFVPPEVLSCQGLDGAALAPYQLAALLSDPLDFFLRWGLGAWRAPRLYDDFNPVREWYVKKILGAEARELLTGTSAGLATQLDARFDAALEVDLERAGMNDDASTGERVRRMARRLARAMLRAEPLAGPGLELEVATVRADLPWRLEGAEGRRTGSGVEWLVEKAPTKKAQQAGFAALAEVAATLARGEAVDELRWVGVDGSQQKAGDPAELLAGFQDRLTLVTEMVQAGAYPGAGPAALRVDGAPASEVSEDWWQAWRDA
ncbi:MAG: hypothetical protein H6719_36500 [Sandaracinaceae bacterium]|nr:hypothetical protein [Sandaracinaceae bacterium]